MPAWPGGPCPNCSDDMPPRMIHCRTCRHLLNTDLVKDSVEIPTFQPLRELETASVLPPRGVYLPCPACDRELKVSARHRGQTVCCKHCEAGFTLPAALTPDAGPVAYYADCPHCRERLRLASKYADQTVACRFCGGRLRIAIRR